jgi:hypothetical protein
VRHFVGGNVPDVLFEDKLTLYVPDSSTYKGFDVFLFVPKNSAKEARLYAFQITGASNVDQHIASDKTSIAPKPFLKRIQWSYVGTVLQSFFHYTKENGQSIVK